MHEITTEARSYQKILHPKSRSSSDTSLTHQQMSQFCEPGYNFGWRNEGPITFILRGSRGWRLWVKIAPSSSSSPSSFDNNTRVIFTCSFSYSKIGCQYFSRYRVISGFWMYRTNKPPTMRIAAMTTTTITTMANESTGAAPLWHQLERVLMYHLNKNYKGDLWFSSTASITPSNSRISAARCLRYCDCRS